MEKGLKQSLDGMFKAKGMAIIGASAKEGKPANHVVQFAKAMDYEGAIYPVNPTSEEILGLKCYKNLLDIPGRVDLVVIVVSADECLNVAQEVVKRRDEKGDVAGAVVITAGFSERGSAACIEREKRLMEIFAQRGIRVIGPNCQGIIDNYFGVNTTFDIPPYPRGNVSIIAQSGAFACSFLMWGSLLNLVGLNKFISIGNSADITVAEILEYLGEDEHTKVIAVYLEGAAQARELMEAAARVTPQKPIVAFKSGRTSIGSTAAQSHTGSLAGNDQIYTGAFKQAGVIRAKSVAEFYHTAAAFSKLPLPRGNRICVLTVVGGPGTICVDELYDQGVVEMAYLAEGTKNHLKEILSPAANVCRPEGYIDMTGSITEKTHAEVFRTVLNDAGVDQIIYLVTPPPFLDEEKLANNIIAGYRSLPEDQRKPLLCVFMFGYLVAKCRKILEDAGIPTLDLPDVAAQVMSNMVRYANYRQKRINSKG